MLASCFKKQTLVKLAFLCVFQGLFYSQYPFSYLSFNCLIADAMEDEIKIQNKCTVYNILSICS